MGTGPAAGLHCRGSWGVRGGKGSCQCLQGSLQAPPAPTPLKSGGAGWAKTPLRMSQSEAEGRLGGPSGIVSFRTLCADPWPWSQHPTFFLASPQPQPHGLWVKLSFRVWPPSSSPGAGRPLCDSLGSGSDCLGWSSIYLFIYYYFFLVPHFFFPHCTARGSGYPYIYTLQLHFSPTLSSVAT